MNDYIEVMVIVEGKTEEIFVESIVIPYLAKKNIFMHATKAKVIESFAEQRAAERFIPFIAVHEFEALLFSNTEILSKQLGIKISQIEEVLTTCGEPEAINNSPQTAPSKRLDLWSKGGKFPKTTTGIAVAKEIGIKQIRQKCPVFNSWLEKLEKLKPLILCIFTSLIINQCY